jgi:hypothetical protein
VARRIARGGSLPHAKCGIGPPRVPDTYIEPFVAYRAWNWNAEGITSLNGTLWTPKVAFEATTAQCGQDHPVPDPCCHCGMYAGIDMQHLIDINYIQRGIHGEVSLWGRLHRHTLGWRAQFAYPKHFIVPAKMVPFDITQAKRRLDMLTEFGIDIWLQPEREARVGQEKIPLWIPDYGYSQQGLSWLVEKRKQWYGNRVIHPLAVGDRVAVLGDMDGGGIGIVQEIEGDDMYYTMFNANVVYRKPVKEVLWNEKNWRWETTGLGFMRRLQLADGALTKCSPLGGDRCRS